MMICFLCICIKVHYHKDIFNQAGSNGCRNVPDIVHACAFVDSIKINGKTAAIMNRFMGYTFLFKGLYAGNIALFNIQTILHVELGNAGLIAQNENF